jgi:putative spermidine/putrescine transport system ATP-binding protein
LVESRAGLTLDAVVKRFDDVVAVAGVSLELPEGRLVSFLGPSGCGKTTLLRMIAGLEKPTEGRIYLNGEDITDKPPHTRDIGMVFQTLALFPHLDVAHNIGYGLKIRRVEQTTVDKRVQELLTLVALEGIGSRRVSQLSGGQRQRVATARALALEPKLFLLDEPLSALDANLREELQIELRLLQQKLGITTIVVTHDQREAMTMSDVVVVMREGRVEQMGAPLDVYRKPATAFVARFIGTTNLLEGRREGDDQIRVGDHIFRVSGEIEGAGDKALISVRPEDARLGTDGPADHNRLPGRIVFERDLGELSQWYVDCGLEENVVVNSPGRSEEHIEQGRRVTVYFPPEACVPVRP